MIARDEPTEAVYHFAQAATLAPSTGRVSLPLGAATLWLNKTTRSREHYKAGLALSGEEPLWHVRLPKLYRQQLSQPETALRILSRQQLDCQTL